MKTIKLSLVALGLLVTQTFALTTQDIEKQIQEIETLPPAERVEKMNELKTELHQLNEQERYEIMREIAQKYHIEHNKAETKMENHKNEYMKDGEGHKAEANHEIEKHEMERAEIGDHQDKVERHEIERENKIERNDRKERDNERHKKDD